MIRRNLLALALLCAPVAATAQSYTANLPATCSGSGNCVAATPIANPDGSFISQARGGSTIVTGQVSVGTTATLVAAARAGRIKVGVTVTTAVQCAYGNAGVTLTTGWPLAAVAYASDSWDTSAALYGVCASTATVGYREQF